MRVKSGFFQLVVFLVGLMFFVVALMFLVATLATLCGCANRGCKVTVSSASVTSLGDINWDEYKIPVFSIFTGPRLVVWINKDYLALSKAKCSGSVTNETSALGIYSDHSCKSASAEMDFAPVTNLITTAEASVD